jgi:hypothetical protein
VKVPGDVVLTETSGHQTWFDVVVSSVLSKESKRGVERITTSQRAYEEKNRRLYNGQGKPVDIVFVPVSISTSGHIAKGTWNALAKVISRAGVHRLVMTMMMKQASIIFDMIRFTRLNAPGYNAALRPQQNQVQVGQGQVQVGQGQVQGGQAQVQGGRGQGHGGQGGQIQGGGRQGRGGRYWGRAGAGGRARGQR